MSRKTVVSALMALLLTLMLPFVAYATSVSLALSSSTASPGESVTASGMADANTWVSIKILDNAQQGIILYDAVKSGTDGSYNCMFKVPSLPGDTLSVVAGYGSNVAVKTLNINNVLTPPTLTADSSGNIAGSAVDLTFTDNTVWRTAISGITVDSTALTTAQYTATAGCINIAAGVLNTVGSHSIVIKATGYSDAVVTQTIGSTVDTLPPAYVGASINSSNKVVIVSYSEAIVNKLASQAELKKSVSFAANGTDFVALGSNDKVSIVGKTLVVTFSSALTGKTNKLKIAANTVKDAAGNSLNTEVTTERIEAGKIDECFIATAAYGSKYQTDVVLLRQFRDRFLLTNPVGEEFVEFYYRNSPPIAHFIAGNGVLKFTVRAILTPIVASAYLALHPRTIAIVVILAILAFPLIKKRKISQTI